MLSFQARTEFEESLEEVRCLLRLAATNVESHHAYRALLKSSILLLMAKMENFLEAIAEEGRFSIQQASRPAAELPDAILLACFQAVIDDAFLAQLRNSNPKAIERLRELTPILANEPVTTLKFEVRFSYGRHGEAEVKKLFSRLGIDDVFSVLPAEEEDDVFPSAIKADINSLTAIRNNIIHSDASPAFTIEQVEGFVRQISEFAARIETVLIGHCNAVCRL